MSTADGSVVMNVNMDVKQAEKQLAKLEKGIEKTEKKVADLTKKRNEAQEKSLFSATELDAEKAKLQEIKDRLADLRAMSKDKSINSATREEYKSMIPAVQEELSDQQKRVNAMQSDWNKIENSVDRYNQQIASANENLELQKVEAGELLQQIEEEKQARTEAAKNAEISDQRTLDINRELLELKQRQKELEGLGLGFGVKEYDQNDARISEITQELKEYKKALTESGKGGGEQSSVQAGAKNIKSVLANLAAQFNKPIGLAKTFGSIINGIAKNLLRIGPAAKKFGAVAAKAFSKAAMGIAQLLNKVNILPKIFNSIRGSLEHLGRIVKSALIFSVLYKGLSLVREQMSAYLGVNTEFSTALRRLNGVLLTAFQPIYNVIVPAITTLMNVLSQAIAVVSQFMAALFGTTAKKAQGNAKELYKEANALKATGAAADEAAGSLAGFDEINTINTESSGGGGGGAETETGPLFDWEYEETPFESWGEAFSAFLDQLLDGIPALETAFEGFASRLNDFTQKLYDMFTFPGVLEKVEQLGRDLANAFNKLVGWIDWKQMGQALGAGLNLALQFLTEFIYTFDWINLGRSLAEMVNGLVSEVDWYDFGRLLWTGFKIGLETLAGFLIGLDMPQLAEAASNLVMGFFDSMTETINNIEWGQIGAQIATFLTDIDWAGIFQSVYDAFNAALDALNDFIIGFLDRIGEQLDMHGITDPLIELVQTVHDFIQTLVSDTINWVHSLDLTPLSVAFQHLLEAISPLVSTISEGLLWAYENVLLPLASWVIEEAAPASVDALSNAFHLINEIVGIVIDVIKILWETMQPVFEWVGGVAVTIIQGLGDIFAKVSDVFQEKGDQINHIFETIGSIISKFWELARPIFESFQKLIEDVFDVVGTIIGDTIGAAIDVLDGLLEFLDGVFSGDWTKIWEGLGKTFTGVWNGIVGVLEGAVNLIISGLNFLIRSLNKLHIDIPATPLSKATTIGFNIPELSKISIPRLAQGAVIPANREFMAVLGDQSHGNNLEAPEGLIRKIVREESGGGGETAALLQAILEAIKAGQVIVMDGKAVTKGVVRNINTMTRQSGRPVVLG